MIVRKAKRLRTEAFRRRACAGYLPDPELRKDFTAPEIPPADNPLVRRPNFYSVPGP